jgi:ribosome-binding ATPase YchF (GTP1/OBG family)
LGLTHSTFREKTVIYSWLTEISETILAAIGEMKSFTVTSYRTFIMQKGTVHTDQLLAPSVLL